MKEQYVPIEKRSKRAQKEYHDAQRKDWGAFNPITRKTPKKVYNRKKSERRWEYEPPFGFFIFSLFQEKLFHKSDCI